jgi:hypothetical protein
MADERKYAQGIRNVTPSLHGCEECLKPVPLKGTCVRAGPVGVSGVVIILQIGTRRPRRRARQARRVREGRLEAGGKRGDRGETRCSPRRAGRCRSNSFGGSEKFRTGGTFWRGSLSTKWIVRSVVDAGRTAPPRCWFPMRARVSRLACAILPGSLTRPISRGLELYGLALPDCRKSSMFCSWSCLIRRDCLASISA